MQIPKVFATVRKTDKEESYFRKVRKSPVITGLLISAPVAEKKRRENISERQTIQGCKE